METGNNAREYITSSTCPRCGKQFCPAPYHIYEDTHGVYCSWTCFNHRNDNRPKVRPKGRPARQVEQLTLDGKLVKTFKTAEVAADAMNACSASIRKACNRYPKQFKNHLWRFKETNNGD